MTTFMNKLKYKTQYYNLPLGFFIISLNSDNIHEHYTLTFDKNTKMLYLIFTYINKVFKHSIYPKLIRFIMYVVLKQKRTIT